MDSIHVYLDGKEIKVVALRFDTDYTSGEPVKIAEVTAVRHQTLIGQIVENIRCYVLSEEEGIDKTFNLQLSSIKPLPNGTLEKMFKGVMQALVNELAIKQAVAWGFEEKLMRELIKEK